MKYNKVLMTLTTGMILVGCGAGSDLNEKEVKIADGNTYVLSADFKNKVPVTVANGESDSDFTATGKRQTMSAGAHSVSASLSSSSLQTVDSFLTAEGELTGALNDFVIESSLVAGDEIVFTIRNAEPEDPSYIRPTKSELADPNAYIPANVGDYMMTKKCLIFKGNLTTNEISCLSSNINKFNGELIGLRLEKGWVIAGNQITWNDQPINDEGHYEYTSQEDFGLHLIEESGPKYVLRTDFKPSVMVANELGSTDALAVSSPYEIFRGTTHIIQNIGEDTQTLTVIPYSTTAINFSGDGAILQTGSTGAIYASLSGDDVKYGRASGETVYDSYSKKLYRLTFPSSKLEGEGCARLHAMGPLSTNQRGVEVNLGASCQNPFKLGEVFNGSALVVQKNDVGFIVNNLDTKQRESTQLCSMDSMEYEAVGFVYNGYTMGYKFKSKLDDQVVACGINWMTNDAVTTFTHEEVVTRKSNSVNLEVTHNSTDVVTLDSAAFRDTDSEFIVAIVSSNLDLDKQSVLNALSVFPIEEARLEPYMTIIDGKTISVFYNGSVSAWRAENVLVNLDTTLLKDAEGNYIETGSDPVIKFNTKFE